MEFVAGIRCPSRHNLRLLLRSGMFNAQIKTASPKGIADAPFFVRGENDEWNALGPHCAQLRNAELPYAQQFQQQGLKRVVHLVQFVDQQDTRLFPLQRAQQRARAEERLAV
jgi:hypothetical protein